jgi:hypothetical protein
MTFEFMKRNKKILIRIIFLLVVFLSIMPIAPSKLITDSFRLELLCVTNESGECFCSDSESVNGDNIDLADRNLIFEQSRDKQSVSQNFSLFHIFTHSIWQPPKIS